MSANSCKVPILVVTAYFRDVVVVIELGAYIHGVLTFNGCLFSQFYGIFFCGLFKWIDICDVLFKHIISKCKQIVYVPQRITKLSSSIKVILSTFSCTVYCLKIGIFNFSAPFTKNILSPFNARSRHFHVSSHR